jgi:hypothetical protein
MNCLVLFKETIDVSSVNHTTPLNTHCGKNAELLNGKAFGTQLCFKGSTVRVSLCQVGLNIYYYTE